MSCNITSIKYRNVVSVEEKKQLTGANLGTDLCLR